MGDGSMSSRPAGAAGGSPVWNADIAGPVPTDPAGQRQLGRDMGNKMVEQAYAQQQASGTSLPAVPPGGLSVPLQTSEHTDASTKAMTDLHAAAAFNFAIPSDPAARQALGNTLGDGIAGSMQKMQNDSAGASAANGGTSGQPAGTQAGAAPGASSSAAGAESATALNSAYGSFYNSLGSNSPGDIRTATQGLREQARQSFAAGQHSPAQQQAMDASVAGLDASLQRASPTDTSSMQALLKSANQLVQQAAPPGTVRPSNSST